MAVIETTREDHRIAWFTALAITIHIAESALPSPLPGVKPGLANVVTLIVLCRYGWRMAVWVSLLRVLVGSVLIGTFLSPTFFLSAAGAMASVAVLGLAERFSRAAPRWAVGPLGLGILAALAHMAGQFWTAYALFIPHAALLHLFPLLMSIAAALGAVSGILTRAVLARLDSNHQEHRLPQ
jgi:heptaprenyl diphosphate synthase